MNMIFVDEYNVSANILTPKSYSKVGTSNIIYTQNREKGLHVIIATNLERVLKVEIQNSAFN